MYKFDGSAFYFLGLLQWTIVVHEARKRNEPNFEEICMNPDLIAKKQKEYGISDTDLVKESIRLLKELDGKI